MFHSGFRYDNGYWPTSSIKPSRLEMICGYPISEIVKCLSAHFLLSLAVASGVYLLTSIIFSEEERRTRLFLCLGCALSVHVLQDYLIGWF